MDAATRLRSTHGRTWIAILAVLALVLGACGSDGGDDAPDDAAADDPGDGGDEDGGDAADGASDVLKVGILGPYTGVFADFGPKVIEDPIQLYLDLHDNQLGGMDVELVTADTQSEPDVALEQAQHLVENEEVDVIVGLVNSAGALAARDYLHDSGTPTMIVVASAKGLTEDPELISPYIFRVSFAGGQLETSGAVLFYEHGIRSMAGIGADYVAGRDHLESLIAAFEELGGEVPHVVWHPLGTADFSSYLTDLATAIDDVDAVTPMMFGGDAVGFFQQYREFGLDAPIAVFGDVTEQSIVLDVVGEEAKGAITYWSYSPYLDNPLNNEFREEYLAAYDRLPGGFSNHSWSVMLFLDEAVSSLGGEVASKDELTEAIQAAEIEAPSGPLSFDENGQVIWTNYLLEIDEGPDGIIAQLPLGPHVTDAVQGGTVADAQANYREE